MKKHVVILGGGVAGVAAARSLAKKSELYKVTLVEVRESHANAYLPDSFQADEVQTLSNHLLSSIAHTAGFSFLRGEVTSVGLVTKEVGVSGHATNFDYLICALGSRADMSVVPGADAVAFPVWTPEDRRRLQHALHFTFKEAQPHDPKTPPSVAIIGGGRVGVGAAASILEYVKQNKLDHARVSIYEAGTRLLGHYSHQAASLADRFLTKEGVAVYCHSKVFAIEGHKLFFTEGEARADIIVWAGASSGVALSTAKQLHYNHAGRIVVNKRFQIRPEAHVFSIGDQAAVPVPHRTPSVEETLQEAVYVAGILPQLDLNQRIPPFIPHPEGEIIPLGHKTALYVYKHIARISPLYAARYRRLQKKYAQRIV